MHFLAPLTLLATTATALTVSYDRGYDDPSRPLTSVACSDGPNGLTTRYGWQTQSQIPHFSNIGGSADIAGWNSAQCGQCYQVTYKNKSLYILAIDHAAVGLNIAKSAMDKLTGGQAAFLGRVEAEVKKVGYQKCAFRPL